MGRGAGGKRRVPQTGSRQLWAPARPGLPGLFCPGVAPAWGEGVGGTLGPGLHPEGVVRPPSRNLAPCFYEGRRSLSPLHLWKAEATQSQALDTPSQHAPLTHFYPRKAGPPDRGRQGRKLSLPHPAGPPMWVSPACFS